MRGCRLGREMGIGDDRVGPLCASNVDISYQQSKGEDTVLITLQVGLPLGLSLCNSVFVSFSPVLCLAKKL